jgi:hypothetical protein
MGEGGAGGRFSCIGRVAAPHASSLLPSLTLTLSPFARRARAGRRKTRDARAVNLNYTNRLRIAGILAHSSAYKTCPWVLR